jgi:predicted nucleic acid-binding protein
MTSMPERRAGIGLADTSLFVAGEQERPLTAVPPERIAVSVITIGELRLGVLVATEGSARAQRLETMQLAELLEPLPVTRQVAARWAALRLALREAGRRMPLNDSWIAATALVHEMPVVSQDDDYDDVPGLDVIKL